MARTYNQQSYQGGYQGSAQSVGFNPVRSLDGSQRERQKGQMAVDAINATKTMQQRQHTIDAQRLAVQKEEGLAYMQLQASKQNTNFKAFQSLLNLTQTGLNTYGKMQQQAEIDAAKAEQEAAQQSKINQTMTGIYGGGWDPEALKNSVQEQAFGQAQGQAIGLTATALEAEGSASAISAAETARQGNPARQYAYIQGNAYTARAAYPAALQQAWDATPFEQRPKTAGGIQAWSQEFTRQFSMASGVMELPAKQQAEILGPSLMNSQAQFLTGVLTGNIKAERTQNKATVQSQASQIMNAQGIPADIKMQQVLQIMRNGNIGYDGVNSGKLNSDAVDLALGHAASNGDTKFIRDLYTSLKIPGQTGTEWGREYDHKFQEAFKQARQAGVQSFNLTQNEAKVQVANVQQRVLSGQLTREAAISEYRNIGTPLALQSANNMISEGLNYDPNLKFDISERASSGNPYTLRELSSLLQAGKINQDEYKTATKGMASVQNQQLAQGVLKPLVKGLDEVAVAGISKGNLDPSAASELPFRMDMASQEIEERLLDAMNANPSLAGNATALRAEALRIKDEVMKQPQYTIDLKGSAGNAPGFGAPIPTPVKSAFTSVAPGIEDFSNVLPSQIPKLQGNPNLTLDPGKDRFLKPAVLRMQAEKVLNGQIPTGHTAEMAKALGYSPTTFVEAQLRAAGLPSLSTMRQVEAAKKEPAPQTMQPGQDYDMKSGYNQLQTLGFPARGAAYLAGNIQQESTWNGQRSWGEVAGDGSDRNGGLVSWMDDAQRNHFRLQNIERYLGKPISQASDAEQIGAMIWEMKRRNPQAYRTFMNPNATPTELRKASRQYWGYGHEGSRYAYAEQLLNTGDVDTHTPVVRGKSGYIGSSNVVSVGLKDGHGRDLKFAPKAAASWQQMIAAGMPYNPAEVASGHRSEEEYMRLRSEGYGAAANGYHNYGEAIDVHGETGAWIRQHGGAYGWSANDYQDSHGGHYEFKG